MEDHIEALWQILEAEMILQMGDGVRFGTVNCQSSKQVKITSLREPSKRPGKLARYCTACASMPHVAQKQHVFQMEHLALCYTARLS